MKLGWNIREVLILIRDIENPILRHEPVLPVVRVSNCDSCGRGLYSDESFIEAEGLLLCDDHCLHVYFNVQEIEGWQMLDE